MRCPHCGGPAVVEPARLRCPSCGRQVDRPHPSRADLIRQSALDRAYQNPGGSREIILGMLVGLEEARAAG